MLKTDPSFDLIRRQDHLNHKEIIDHTLTCSKQGQIPRGDHQDPYHISKVDLEAIWDPSLSTRERSSLDSISSVLGLSMEDNT